jgi:hypothetical protein
VTFFKVRENVNIEPTLKPDIPKLSASPVSINY